MSPDPHASPKTGDFRSSQACGVRSIRRNLLPDEHMRRVTGMVLARILSSILQFMTLVVLTNRSAIDEFGMYATALGWGAILAGILALGLPTLALRTPPEEQAATVPAMGFVTTLGAAIALVTIIALGHVVLMPLSWWLAAAATFVASEMVHTLHQGVLLASLKPTRAEQIMVARRAIPLLLAAPALQWNYLLFPLLTAGNILVLAMAFLTSDFPLRPDGTIGALVARSRAYWVANIGAMMQQLDVTIINLVLGATMAGAYSAAFRLASPIHIVTASLVGVMLPSLARAGNRVDRLRQGRRFLLLSVAYAGLLAVLAPSLSWLGPIILGQQYKAHAWLFPVLFINSALSVVNQVLSARLFAEHAAAAVSAATTLATTIGLVAILLLSWCGSFAGAVMGVVSIQIVLLGLLFTAWHLRVTRKIQEV